MILRNSPPKDSQAIPNHPPWGFYEVVTCLLLAYLAVPLVLTSVMELILPQLQESTHIFVAQYFPILSWLGIFWVLARRYQTSLWAWLGLKREKPLSYYAFFSLVTIIGVVGIFLLLSLILHLSGQKAPSPYESMGKEEIKTMTFFALVSAPFVEEVVFRGFIQAALYRYLPPYGVIAVTACLFAMMHGGVEMEPLAWVYIGSLGLLFSTIRDKTGSIYPCMLGHLFNNTLAAWNLSNQLH